MTSDFVPARVKEVRELRGKTQAAVADYLNVTPAAVSAWELGVKPPGAENLLRLAQYLDVPFAGFFSQKPPKDPRTSTPVFRKKSRTTQRDMSRVFAVEELLSDIHALFKQRIQWPRTNLPSVESYAGILSVEDIEEIAQEVRRAWGMGNGPIANLGRFLENNGLVWARFQLPDDTDGISNWRGEDALIIVSSGKTAFRQRFSLAHELGHLVLHRFLDESMLEDPKYLKQIEFDADRFAGAFLFPAKAYFQEVRSLSIEYLLELKRRWRLSMGAIAMRGKHLGLFNDDRVGYFFQNLSRRTGSRVREPGDHDLEVELPSLFAEALDALLSADARVGSVILADSGASLTDFTAITGISKIDVSDVETPSKIIAFRRDL